MSGGTPVNPHRAPAGLRAWAGALLAGEDGHFRKVLDALPAAIYITDAEGRLTYYNDEAANLWGYRPELGAGCWRGSWRLFPPDGTDLPFDQWPMAIALRDGRPVRGMEALAERPDGIRIPFIPFPTPLYDDAGTLIGAVNMLVDITDRKQAEEDSQRLASIVECSDDAIVSKDIDGIIRSWNRGAERLFGYAAEEAIGHPINILIPPDRQNEEIDILARIRRGEKIDHYETVRQRKDGGLIAVSLCVSPVKNAQGRIVGASKIARDITERKRAEEFQHTLLREMDHRVKNLFTLSSSVVAMSARSAATAQELASAVTERLGALARAHALTLPKLPQVGETGTTLHALVETIAAPFDGKSGGGQARIAISGPDIPVGGSAVSSLALLLHEFATNAAKYGALSVPDGYIEIEGSERGDQFLLTWQEHGGPRVTAADGEGFGTLLARATVKRQLGGEISRDWRLDGLTIRLSFARDRVGG